MPIYKCKIKHLVLLTRFYQNSFMIQFVVQRFRRSSFRSHRNSTSNSSPFMAACKKKIEKKTKQKNQSIHFLAPWGGLTAL